ncbi:MAG: type III-B CRISPR module-associated Cmr3 family protein [Ktedonobacteraceae bacterium]
MRLFIEPTEPLLFRTGRPFDAGQDTFAESLFPPTPETLQGAVRATIANYWNPQKNSAAAFDDPELTMLIGDRNGYGRFRLTGISLGRYTKDTPEMVERLFSFPAHIVHASTGPRLLRLLPHPFSANTRSNMPEGVYHYLAPAQGSSDDMRPVDGWLTETDLYKALQGDDLTGIEIVRRGDVYQEEPRLGIGIQPGTKANQEGFLYQMLMIRMNHALEHPYRYGFVVDVHLASASPNDTPLNSRQVQQELHLPDTGWMTLGGEQRTAHFRVLQPATRPNERSSRERTLLYLATPAIFDTGWKPSPRFVPLDALLTAAINRYESIGGWKLLQPGSAQGENKVMYRCVPAGSVYFFDTHVKPHQPVTDHGMEIGYGITFEGEW